MEDDNSMSDRILRTLESIINNDGELNDFLIIPCENNTKNKTPVVYEEHNLGLESWCVKHIYRYAYLELFEFRMLPRRKKLLFCKEHSLNYLLMGVLLINPDVATFWNMKRELVDAEILSVSNELYFTKLVQSYKGKSNEAFVYRRWLIKRFINKLNETDLETLLQKELKVCEATAAKNENNYHSWTHRIWCMEQIGPRLGAFLDILYNELEFSHRWVSNHVSEHSGFHYRQYLFKTVRDCKRAGNIYEVYYDEVVKILELVNENDPCDITTYLLGKSPKHEDSGNFSNFLCLLIYDLYNTLEILNTVYPNHESIWYHRRYLIHELITSSYNYHGLQLKKTQFESIRTDGTNIVNACSGGEKESKIPKTHPNKVEGCVLYNILVSHEMDFIKKNSQSMMFHGVELAKRYEQWLRFVICIESV